MTNVFPLKTALRKKARSHLEANRPLRDEKSSLIWDRLSSLEVFQLAWKRFGVMSYLDFQDEVQTTRFFFDGPGAQPPALVLELIVPYCEQNDIVPFRLRTLDELEPGCMGIPEPKKSLRQESGRIVDPQNIELVLVPGLAFDASGNRLGRGAGYYDRFLARLRPSTVLIGLAFECQVFESVPVEPHDRPVDFVVTERTIHPRSRQDL